VIDILEKPGALNLIYWLGPILGL